jgi:two-component system, OmpR family, sensor kinase
MFKSLFARLTIALLLVFCLLGVLLVSVTLLSSRLYQEEVMQKLNRDLAEHIVSDTKIIMNGKINHPAIKDLFHSLMLVNPSLEIYLLDQDGNILEYSAPPWKVVRLSVDLGPIYQFLGEHQRFPLTGEDPRDNSTSKIFSTAPIYNRDQVYGYLYVILGGENYDDIVNLVQSSYILKLSLLVIVIGLLFAATSGVFLVAGVSRRIEKLANAMIYFRENLLINPAVFPTFKKDGDEIDQLTETFRDMAEKILKQIEDLQTTDNLRRELVANVSHDLRTPLATLQGYIETLLIKEQQLQTEQRQQYLEIAIRHCHKLNKLVAELFELAKLDARETTVNKETFNLAELVQDIAQKFIFSAKDRHITLETQTDLSNAFVYADISLIERAIENLIENALRYTSANGLIKITLQDKGSSILVQVSDNGCGIPESEIPYIFDRFYQLDKSRNNRDNSSGLGLAIVKRIIELHQSVINVTSIPAGNTTFKFTLPVHFN